MLERFLVQLQSCATQHLVVTVRLQVCYHRAPKITHFYISVCSHFDMLFPWFEAKDYYYCMFSCDVQVVSLICLRHLLNHLEVCLTRKVKEKMLQLES